MAILTVKDWHEFQHYRDRSPPWIKLHKYLLDNYEYQCLPVASRALAPMLWLLASESKEGEIDGDLKKIAFRLRVPEKEIMDGLKPLIDAGFIISDSDLIADCYQSAMPETEGETEREAEANRGAVKKSRRIKKITLSEFGEWENINGQLEVWKAAYPHLDIEQELKKAAAWVISNPEKKKSLYSRFLNNWFSHAEPSNSRPDMFAGAI